MELRDLDRTSRLRLVRFVCSFAWADLEMADAERNFVTRLLAELDLDPEERAEAEQWLKVPPLPEDIDPLDIPEEHRQVFLNAALQVVGADGQIEQAEMETLALFERLLRANPEEDTYG